MEEGMSGGFCIKPRGGGGSRGGGGGTKCGRWNPTSEQVKVLTDLFRSGLRTPSTDQIQKISSQLSFYGKIESKNVFYWFQNHKARERQKRRRVLLDDNPNDIHLFRHDKLPITSSTRQMGIGERNNFELSDPAERVIETLQLFPLAESENPRMCAQGCKENKNTSSFSYSIGNEMDHHAPLELRLSFL